MENPTMIQFFEWYCAPDGLLWQRTMGLAEFLKRHGFDMIWLPPAYKGAAGPQDVGYGVYDLYDLGEFDQKGSVRTKYGTRDEYLKAIKALQRADFFILVDIVLNHRMGADEKEQVEAEKYDPNNRTQPISGESPIEAWTKYTFPGRKGKYSDFVWDWTCFTGVDWDDKSKSGGVYQLEGKEWSTEVDGEKGNYDYLMGADVDVENPKVAEELTKWGEWYVALTDAAGLRLDAVKHIDYGFYNNWVATVRKASKRDLFVVGEYWSPELKELTDYLGHCNGCMSLFDVPLHMNLYNASRGGGQFGMRNIFQNTLVAADPMHAVTFVDNHDTQPGQALESWVEDWFKPLAYALVLLRQDGLPCVFYADLFGLRSDGQPPVADLRRMLIVRKKYAYGPQHDYFDHDNIVGWTREGDADHPHSGCAVLLTDGPGGEKEMYVGKQFAGQVFLDVTRREIDEVTINDDGNGLFKVPGGGVTVYLPQEAYRHITVHYE